jgi:S-adenosylmethionine:tRNA ribosyltransferase-isomerase
LVERADDRNWFCLVDGIKKGTDDVWIRMNDTEVRVKRGTPYWTAEFPATGDAERIISKEGRMPLPHYIKRAKSEANPEDYERYQTVYANEAGSIAAPTAGLHFDNQLLRRIESAGVQVTTITLHIGIGTFFLIKSEEVECHRMHREFFHMPVECARKIGETKEKGGRVIAVGTSAVRTLESAWSQANGEHHSGYTELYIYPGYVFRVVDSLITNFHLPRSTPLMLVSAFAGRDAIQAAYREAIEQRYRFYSYGDAMFIS